MLGFVRRYMAKLSDEALYRRPKTRRPQLLGCEKDPDGIHKWNYSGSWNGNHSRVLPFETRTDGIARPGWRCYHCGKFHWDDRDEVFALEYAYHMGYLPGAREYVTKGVSYTLTNGRSNAPYYNHPTKWADPEV
jgi:hypothetical protein